MYVTFNDYFKSDDDPEKIINDHLDHHAKSEFANDLYSCERFEFLPAVIPRDGDDVTIWLKPSGRDTMKHALSDLVTVLDAGDAIDWSKIPRDCGGTLHG